MLHIHLSTTGLIIIIYLALCIGITAGWIIRAALYNHKKDNNMTYREAIQIQISALQKVYDNAGSLRDAALQKEKIYWNETRKLLPEVWRILQQLDDHILTNERAEMELKGNYNINTNE